MKTFSYRGLGSFLGQLCEVGLGGRPIISIPQRRIATPKVRCVARGRARTGIQAFGHFHPGGLLQVFFPVKARPLFTLPLPTKDWDPPYGFSFLAPGPLQPGVLVSFCPQLLSAALFSRQSPLRKVTVSDLRESEGAPKTFLNQLGGHVPQRRKCVMWSHNPILFYKRCDL